MESNATKMEIKVFFKFEIVYKVTQEQRFNLGLTHKMVAIKSINL